MKYLIIKSLLDRLISFMLLLLLSPVIIITIILLYLFNNKEVFFIQERPGMNEKIYRIIKFKTMNNKVNTSGDLLPDELRITKLGRYLRNSSIDELPQLINVIKGEMSIVGPRPLLKIYLTRYNHSQKKRHNVKPGITGWAQVNGRNAIEWNDRLNLDVWYVENMSFSLDIKILFLTIKRVITSEGVSNFNVETMPEFKGEKNI